MHLYCRCTVFVFRRRRSASPIPTIKRRNNNNPAAYRYNIIYIYFVEMVFLSSQFIDGRGGGGGVVVVVCILLCKRLGIRFIQYYYIIRLDEMYIARLDYFFFFYNVCLSHIREWLRYCLICVHNECTKHDHRRV